MEGLLPDDHEAVGEVQDEEDDATRGGGHVGPDGEIINNVPYFFN